VAGIGGAATVNGILNGAVTRVKEGGGGNYVRLKRGRVIGGQPLGTPWPLRRRGRCPWRGGERGGGGGARPVQRMRKKGRVG
jgi:hypothetical protein